VPLLSTARGSRGPSLEAPVHRLRLPIVTLVALTLSFTGLAGASASSTSTTRAPQVKDLNWKAEREGRSEVEVSAKYRCWGPSDQMHLWVSVKQGGPDPTAEGSSTTVKAWYDTNISQDVKVTCDGQWHSREVELGRHPLANKPGDTDTTPPSRRLGYLHEGKAWLQFCLVPMQDPSGLASKSRWVTVTDENEGHDRS
jgi:hypothetical protein